MIPSTFPPERITGFYEYYSPLYRSSHPEVFLGKGVLKLCIKFTGEHPCRSGISIKLQSNFIKITLQQVCSPVNLLNIFRTPFTKNTSGWLLLTIPAYRKLKNHEISVKCLSSTLIFCNCSFWFILFPYFSDARIHLKKIFFFCLLIYWFVDKVTW